MRAGPLLLLLLAGCYNPTFVPGQVACGPNRACPPGLVCGPDDVCVLPDGGSEDLALSPPDLSQAPGAELSTPADLAPPPSPFLRVSGPRIVDGHGRPVRLTGVSWFGLESSAFAPQGLWARSLSGLLGDVKGLGYNFVRLPWSNQLLEETSRPVGISREHNPDLADLTGLQLLDRIIAEAGRQGLRVMLTRYQASPAAGATGLWYTPGYPEQRWIGDWVQLAMRYRTNPTVVAFDLHNEPHQPATWGSGDPQTDWRLAAERAGRAILAVHPELLIVVQGIDSAGGAGYWWGGNLRGVRSAPVRLPADRLVYGTNDYPSSVFNQSWFRDANYPNNLPAVWDSMWGFVFQESDPARVAPVLITGFGGRNESNSDKQWLTALGNYIMRHQLSFAYWCLNPDRFYGGILLSDWTRVSQRHGAIQPLLAPPLP
ncbi:MAG: glycoside hydrolase family 5 protein [Myxococcales bacterium]|nr:glycoside hydrolase family 5 protein [Myxococcota bacterium]MDW8282927.1 glycoside hydrolase family 5 protein [Myxococcales bacterium]